MNIKKKNLEPIVAHFEENLDLSFEQLETLTGTANQLAKSNTNIREVLALYGKRLDVLEAKECGIFFFFIFF